MNWHKYYFSMVDLVASKSKDLRTKVGCIIVGPDKDIRSTGYNGFPRGVNDNIQERLEAPAKYMWTEHAERNALYNALRSGTSVKDCYMFMRAFPCADCSRGIIQSGIKYLVIAAETLDEQCKYWKDRWEESIKCSTSMLKEAGISILISFDDGKDFCTLVSTCYWKEEFGTDEFISRVSVIGKEIIDTPNSNRISTYLWEQL